MKVARAPHPWRLSPQQAIRAQKRMAAAVSLGPAPTPMRWVLGLDCAIGANRAFAVGVVWDVFTRRVLEVRGASAALAFPYVPGLLSFREAPVLLRVLRKIGHPVHVLMCDGQGIAHPRRFGLACHLGALTHLPSCGAAKSLLVGECGALGEERGAQAPLMLQGERIGTALRTRAATKPIYSSPGHRIDIEQAAALTLACSCGRRMPEPTRLADRWAGMLKRGEVTQRTLRTAPDNAAVTPAERLA